ncbi:hypothetical protein [Burkholderia sp. BE12]|uniref:hypothetical protein n=1 Tax=Burkholderia sp. BE12 TaxID=2082394 RepID=UPI00131A3D3E|nr:hypothetical protein [Burkholderia sp. BE12]
MTQSIRYRPMVYAASCVQPVAHGEIVATESSRPVARARSRTSRNALKNGRVLEGSRADMIANALPTMVRARGDAAAWAHARVRA